MGFACSGFECLPLLAVIYFPHLIVFGAATLLAVIFAKRGTKGTFWGRFFKILLWIFLIVAGLFILHLILFVVLNFALGDVRPGEFLEDLRRTFGIGQ